MKIFTLFACLLLPLWAQAANQKVVLDIQKYDLLAMRYFGQSGAT